MKKQGNQAITKVLGKWARALPDDSSCKSLWKLRDLYPHLVGNVL